MPESVVAEKPATTTATQAPPSAPPSPPPASSAPEAPKSDAASSSATETTTPSSPSWQTAIDSVEVRELLKHPKIAGALGDLAQRRAQQERQKWDAEQEQRRLRDLRDADPHQYVEEQKRIEEQTAKAQQAEAGFFSAFDTQLNDMYGRLSDTDKRELAGKNFGTGMESRLAALDEFSKRLARNDAAEIAKKDRSTWEKQARESIRKEVLAEINREEPAPDTGGGQAPPGALTAEEFERNRGDATWRRANRERINTYLASAPVRRR
ncbi:MAG: hypothetical protein KGL39_05390 [Patescibacteria group bacterium]|nr:hypothetical protein [Patescibacteria group bacterium]